jgi:4-hydroxythreonine-4-phosphate dehydrogenase
MATGGGTAVLALTMGEPAGIGPEIAVRAWLARRTAELPPFLLLADPALVAASGRMLGCDLPLAEVAGPEEAASRFASALPVAPLALTRPAVPGRPEPANAAVVTGAIDLAVNWALAGRVAAVVTNPMQKATLYDAGFAFQGHTDYLAHLCKCAGRSVMMLVAPMLRVVPVTVHLGLRQAIESLSSEAIVETGRITARALARDFACPAPRLAAAGLNPHAGEGGSLGREEIEIIAPALQRLRAEGIDVRGPLAADSMFHETARSTYDAALCMYHDQALIPLKTLDFKGGVNVTLGLPIIRTSPDHGTALDIAGSGRAWPTSLLAALRLAAEIAERRRAYDAVHT